MIKHLGLLSCAGLLLSVAACNEPKTVPAGEAINTTVTVDDGFYAQERSWRTVDPENLMLIETDYGRIGIELYPEIAPLHVAQIKTLVRSHFYDGLLFHRVIDGFMNQTGDPTGTGSGDSELSNIPGEFTFRRATNTMPVTIIDVRPVNPRDPQAGETGVGFLKALPIATEHANEAASSEDGKVRANGLHCKGVTSMARTGDPNSANSQFFLMRGTAQWLDGSYSVWGNTVIGLDLVESFNVGTTGQDFSFQPDKMNSVTMAADLPEDKRPVVKVLRSKGADFKRYIDSLKTHDGAYPDICDIHLPVRLEQ